MSGVESREYEIAESACSLANWEYSPNGDGDCRKVPNLIFLKVEEECLSSEGLAESSPGREISDGKEF